MKDKIVVKYNHILKGNFYNGTIPTRQDKTRQDKTRQDKTLISPSFWCNQIVNFNH